MNSSTITVDEVLCCICQKVLVTPVSCKTCETHFCHNCISSWQKKKNKCPFNCELDIHRASKVVNSLLSKLKIKCYYNTNGCEFVEIYETTMKHEQSCKNKIVKCVHCNKETDEKLKHEENCIDYYKTMFKALKNENEELCKSSRSSLISNSLIKSNIDANFEIRLNREESKSNEQFKIIEEKEEEISELKPEEVESNNTFTNWLKEGKAEFKNINIQIKGKESMIFASKTSSVDEEIMFIPSKLIITFDKIKKEKIFSKINFSHLNIPQQIGAYTIFLIIEKKKKESFWSPYINILSDDFYSIGLFFEDYELHWLRGSTLFEEIRGKKEELKKFYSLLSAEIDCTWDEFCWAYSNANGNNFGIKEKKKQFNYNLFSAAD